MAHTPEPAAIVLVLTTVGLGCDATTLARTLVEEGLAACVSVQPPMISVYRWKGQVESASEQQIVIKSTSGRVDALRARLLDLHPYEVPELLVVPAAALLPAYAHWLCEAVGEVESRDAGKAGAHSA